MVERDPHQLLADANGLASAGRYEEAILAYEAAIAAGPTLRAYRLVVGELLFELQRYEAAAAVFEEEALTDPSRAQAFEALARARQMLGDRFGAIGAVDRAIALAPQWAEAIYLSALLHIEVEMEPQGRALLKRALALDPNLAARATEDGL